MNYLRACPKPVRKEKIKNPLKKVVIESNPLEDVEQKTVTDWLKAHNILFTANVPDRRICHRLGYMPGVPDIFIFLPPPAYNGKYKGVALELKRRKGGVVSCSQQEWLEKLSGYGWLSYVARGADDALILLDQCGYGRRKS
jgi:hypothetical protein